MSDVKTSMFAAQKNDNSERDTMGIIVANWATKAISYILPRTLRFDTLYTFKDAGFLFCLRLFFSFWFIMP